MKGIYCPLLFIHIHINKTKHINTISKQLSAKCYKISYTKFKSKHPSLYIIISLFFSQKLSVFVHKPILFLCKKRSRIELLIILLLLNRKLITACSSIIRILISQKHFTYFLLNNYKGRKDKLYLPILALSLLMYIKEQ